jgi:hypothetical protein
LRLLPWCAPLDPQLFSFTVSRLSACTQLSGDRLAAASALNEAIRLARIDGGDDIGAVRRAFARDATLDWSGTRSGGEDFAAARLWLAMFQATNESTHFQPLRAHGESTRRVRIEGVVSRVIEIAGRDEAVFQRADAEQTWVSDGYAFTIESATVGRFR